MKFRSKYLLLEALDRMEWYTPYMQKNLERNPTYLASALDRLTEFLARNKKLRENPKIAPFIPRLQEWAFELPDAYERRDWKTMDKIHKEMLSFAMLILSEVSR